MVWKKLGLVFNPKEHQIDWIKSHALIPTPLLLDDRIRVYYTARNHQGQSCTSFVDLERDNPKKIMYVHPRPILEKGTRGTFDDCGVIGTCALRVDNYIYLYYNGYNVRNTVPYSNAIGLARSEDGGMTFNRVFEGPVIDRNANEPYFAVSAFVMKTEDRWNVWYASGTKWLDIENRIEPLYVIKCGHSIDGVNWIRENATCIHPRHSEEANARPSIIWDEGRWKMWFTYRGSRDFRDGIDSYRIGYAESSDLINWVRQDELGISLGSPGEWDSTMQTYPFVFCVGTKKYLFYNGNGFGFDGFGCAIAEGGF